MMKDTLVSVIVPCYNCSGTLKKCIESIRDQTYGCIEIILVDDGSEDDSSAMCDEYVAKDKRITTIHQENGGLVRAWKAGVRRATGEYIVFCDSDDYIDNDLVEKTVQTAVKTGADIITFGAKAEYSGRNQSIFENKLSNSLYTADEFRKIKDSILFTGEMGSQIILSSRWSKLYRKTLLMECLDDISDRLTNGEDAVTTYVTVIKAESLFNIADYYPYHYLRNNQSMVGKHDPTWFAKMAFLRDELSSVSKKYGRQDAYQIDNYFFSNVLIYAKKEIARSREAKEIIVKDLLEARNSEALESALHNVDSSRYSAATSLFATLFIKKRMTLLYSLTKAAGLLGYGKP